MDKKNRPIRAVFLFHSKLMLNLESAFKPLLDFLFDGGKSLHDFHQVLVPILLIDLIDIQDQPL